MRQKTASNAQQQVELQKQRVLLDQGEWCRIGVDLRTDAGDG
jgi:hypothetical protein